MVKQVKERKVKDVSKAKQVFKYPEVGVPFLWPVSFFIGLEEEGLEVLRDDIKFPVYLLAGAKDDITPKEQVFNAEKHLGTKKSDIVKDTTDGGHIGLFMGSKPLREDWPRVAKWIKAHPGR